MPKNFRNKSADVHQFAMIPKADIPRSSFRIEKMHKTTIDAGFLYPIYVDEVLPGDTFNLRMTMFGRMATPIFPVMDNMYLDSFFFFVPNRLVWTNWVRFMGEQKPDPDSSTSFVLPTVTSAAGGFDALGIYDYMGLPTVGQVDVAEDITVMSLPLRAYNLIWNEWFRDENLQDSVVVSVDDGPDSVGEFALLRRGKRKDYFTAALPWPQKGPSVPLPLGGTAPVYGNGLALALTGGNTAPAGLITETDGSLSTSIAAFGQPTGASPGGAQIPGDRIVAAPTAGALTTLDQSGLVADLSAATAATINQIRQSFQIQRLLERDARGGTRYTELVRAHFGVVSPDARLQRPEYLGGGSQRVSISPVPQTSETDATPQGNLAGMGTVLANGHGFTQSFTEHGLIIGMVALRADLTYQQGIRRMWSRSTRYDFYFPAFAHLGEQAILQKEIYASGDPLEDNLVFGYQERWAEYRYNPSMITGLFRSTTTGTIDAWHLAQRFITAPTLNDTFIQDTPPLERVIAVGEEAGGQQFILDTLTEVRAARPMPMYSVPGLIDHF